MLNIKKRQDLKFFYKVLIKNHIKNIRLSYNNKNKINN